MSIWIKRVEITSFGKLRDLSLSFENPAEEGKEPNGEGIHLLEAPNESGKSTLASFVKFCLYGFANSRSQSISENEKKLFTPWESAKAEGKLWICKGDKEYRIARSVVGGKETVEFCDAATGKAVFSAKDSTITTNKGDSFYVTNTTATINLENNKIVNNDSDGNFLRIQKDSWGNSGSNGGTVTLNMTNQSATGNIVVDSISKLTMELKNGSSFKGKINSDNSGEVSVILDKSSSIKLTGDTYVKSLINADSTNSNIDLNGYKLYVDGVELD